MKEPLKSFADRIIRCGEVEEFIEYLIEKGAFPLEPITTESLAINLASKRIWKEKSPIGEKL